MRISDWSSDVCSSDLGIDRVGEDIGAVDALEAECGSGGAAGRDREEFTRRLDRRERRIAVGDVGAHAIGQAAEDAGRIAVAELLLDARAIVLFVEIRSEEHTSELQSLMRTSYAVFCFKKKKQTTII